MGKLGWDGWMSLFGVTSIARWDEESILGEEHGRKGRVRGEEMDLATFC